ncbi:MAG: hypothetical protein ACRC7N_11375, partial [Clostridium sp.]
MKSTSIKKKLIIILLLFTLIPSLLFSIVSYLSSTKSMDKLVNDSIIKNKDGIDRYLKDSL